jgi:hypothetical protein
MVDRDIRVTPPDDDESDEIAVDETQPTESQSAQSERGYILPLIYIFLVAIVLVDVFYIITQGPEMSILRPARETLRSIGSAQLAYQGSNNNKFYGSLGALVENGDLYEDATHTNLILHYSLSWEVFNSPRQIWHGATICGGLACNSFTIIAWPDRQRVLFTDLKTFAITEDQVIRQFDLSNGNNLNVVST